MNRNKFSILLVAILLSLYANNSIAETRNVDVNYHRSVDGHSENINRDYHVSNRNDDARFNNSRVGNSEHFNNDTFNIDRNREVFNTSNMPYRGWNQGPIGMGNGWDSGWNHGYEEGGWGTGLMEGLIGGIAATSLFNYFFNHNSTTPVVYANGNGSYNGGSSSTNMDQQPPDDITNNTTNNTVIDDGGSSVGYWLLGLGLATLVAIGLIYALRRPRRSNSFYEDDLNYRSMNDERGAYSSRTRSRQAHTDSDDYEQIEDQYPRDSVNSRSSRVPQREHRRRGQ